MRAAPQGATGPPIWRPRTTWVKLPDMLWFTLLALMRFGRPPPAWTDAELVERVVAGEPRARRELARRIEPILRAHVLMRTRGRPIGARDPDDLVQDAWGRLFERDAQRLRQFDPARMSLKGYANLIAGNAVATAAAREAADKRRPAGGVAPIEAAGDVDDGRDAQDDAATRDTLRALWQHLDATLAPMGRLVLTALFVDHMSPAEAADALGIKRATVDSWRFKIKKAAVAWRAAHKISESESVSVGERGSRE